MNQRGITLIEAIVAISITLSLVLAVGYLFATGRGNVDRLAWRRAALAQAQSRLEELLHNPSPVGGTNDTTGFVKSYNVFVHTAPVFKLNNVRPATETWSIWWEDDPADGLGGADDFPYDNKRVRETVRWFGVAPESVSIESTLPQI